MSFLLRETSRANNDFSRLKLGEGLIPLLAHLHSPDFIPALTAFASNEKKRIKLLESHLILDLSEPETDRAFFSFTEMVRSRKTFFCDLLENFQPLLAELSIGDQS